MESKIPRFNKPLSRWKQIVIHDKSNKIKKVYNLDDNQRLKRSKRQPKRKLNIKELMLRKMLEDKELQNKLSQIIPKKTYDEYHKDFHENDLNNQSEKSEITPTVNLSYQSLTNELLSSTELNSENKTLESDNNNFIKPDKNDDFKNLFNSICNITFESNENNSDDCNQNDEWIFY